MIYTARLASPVAAGNDAFVTFAGEGNPDTPGDEMENRIAALFYNLQSLTIPGTGHNVMASSTLVEVTRRLATPGSPTEVMPILTASVTAILTAWEALDPDYVYNAFQSGSGYIGVQRGYPYIAPIGTAVLVREQSQGVKGRCYIPFIAREACDPYTGLVGQGTKDVVKHTFDLFHRLPYNSNEPTGNHSGVYSRKNNAFYHATAVSVSEIPSNLSSRRR
jgi:hypothetical protein